MTGMAEGIDDAEAGHAVDAQVGVEHGEGVVVGAHAAGANGVVEGFGGLADVGAQGVEVVLGAGRGRASVSSVRQGASAGEARTRRASRTPATRESRSRGSEA